MTIFVRNAQPSDIPFLAECNAAMARETERRILDRGVLERGAKAVFDDPRRGFYLIAECAGEPAGCLLVTFEWSDWRCGEWWWIQSVNVLPAARRRGVFRALYGEVARRAREARAVGLRLYVERDNTRAQATYLALGMQEEPYRMMRQDFVEQDSFGGNTSSRDMQHMQEGRKARTSSRGCRDPVADAATPTMEAIEQGAGS